MKRRNFLLSSLAVASSALISSSASAKTPTKIGEIGVESNIEDLERVTQTLVNPPNLPEHDQIAKGGPKVVQMTMTVEEKEIEVKPGVFVQAMTFNGTNPGPMIVVHQDDYVELTLKNPNLIH